MYGALASCLSHEAGYALWMNQEWRRRWLRWRGHKLVSGIRLTRLVWSEHTHTHTHTHTHALQQWASAWWTCCIQSNNDSLSLSYSHWWVLASIAVISPILYNRSTIAHTFPSNSDFASCNIHTLCNKTMKEFAITHTATHNLLHL